MNLTDAIIILRTHNKWRRGAEIEMTDPTVLGEAIDVVVKATSRISDLEEAVKELHVIWQANSSEAKRHFIEHVIGRNANEHGGVYYTMLKILKGTVENEL